MNVQFIANEENQDRTQRRKNQACGMESIVCGARKHVGNGTPKYGSDDAEYDRPKDRNVHMHY
jgi:hypothetical protein